MADGRNVLITEEYNITITIDKQEQKPRFQYNLTATHIRHINWNKFTEGMESKNRLKMSFDQQLTLYHKNNINI
ncbi:hypothetical protein HHI36_006410, partial [Cryptolaemus montrouzieri]